MQQTHEDFSDHMSLHKSGTEKRPLSHNLVRYGNKNAHSVLIQAVGDHDLPLMESEASLIKELYGGDFLLLAFGVDDWNRDLSPWEAPAVFGNDGFEGHAGDTFARILKLCDDPGRSYYIGGYSLSGLFALYAAYQTGVFAGVAAASPSMWFPGFIDHMRQNKIQTDRVYLSLGDREEKTSHPVVSRVGECIKSAKTILDAQGISCELEWNAGNHFREPDLRTAKAFARILREN